MKPSRRALIASLLLETFGAVITTCAYFFGNPPVLTVLWEILNFPAISVFRQLPQGVQVSLNNTVVFISLLQFLFWFVVLCVVFFISDISKLRRKSD